MDVARPTEAGTHRIVMQGIAWRPEGRGEVDDLHACQHLEAGSVAVRYGRLYGRGTFDEIELPPPPRIQVDAAAEATPPLATHRGGVVTITDPGACERPGTVPRNDPGGGGRPITARPG